MKRIFSLLILTFLGLPTPAYAIDFAGFHNKNFDAINDLKCGLHVEVSGYDIVLTDIVPPRHSHISTICEHTDWRQCIGSSNVYTCDSNGNCSYFSEDKDLSRLYRVKLLADGNLLVNSIKFFQSKQQQFLTCPIR